MLDGKVVRIRFRKQTDDRPSWSFVGRVVEFSDAWIGVEGKGIFLYTRRMRISDSATLRGSTMHRLSHGGEMALPYDVDEDVRTLVFPREGILSVRILPDSFDVGDIQLNFVGRRVDLVVEGGPDSALDEFYED